jgi:phosphatidylserine/phosphatidylglycerophosphate/cardiolipin synthase-like enzyme
LHDTGSILADENVQRRLRGLFADLWNDAIRHASAFEGLKNALWRAQHRGSWRDMGVYSRLRGDLDRIDTSVSIRRRNAPPQPAAIPAHDVNQLELTLTLPQGSVWGALTETDQRYRRTIESAAGASDTIYIESQYFPDRAQSRAIHRAWVASGREGMRGAIHSDQDLLEFPPFAHIVIPYKPSTSPFDVSFLRESDFDAFLAGEFHHLRWLEIKTMRLIREVSGDEWKRTYTLTSQSRISMPGGADADPDYLDDDTEVTITKVEEYGTRQPVDAVTRKVKEFLPEGDVSVYTVAASDGTLPTGSTAQERQRKYLEDHGIYVHSKAAIFLRYGGAGHEATVGSTNLNTRSLRAGSLQPDTEGNVWWAHDESIERWYNALLGEHTGMSVPSGAGVISGHAIRSTAFEQLNRVRTGQRPLQHLVKLDLADRWKHLDPTIL